MYINKGYQICDFVYISALFLYSLLNGVEISDEGESKWGRRSLV